MEVPLRIKTQVPTMIMTTEQPASSSHNIECKEFHDRYFSGHRTVIGTRENGPLQSDVLPPWKFRYREVAGGFSSIYLSMFSILDTISQMCSLVNWLKCTDAKVPPQGRCWRSSRIVVPSSL